MNRGHSSNLTRNETLRSIMNRHSVRMFKDEPVTDHDLETLLDAANRAPSAHNEQAWRFIILKGAKKQALSELVTTQTADFPRSARILLRMASRSIVSAPVVIAVANTGELIKHGTKLFEIDTEKGYDFFRTMEIQSSAAAVENLLLAATSLGLGAVWLGVLFLIKNEVLRFLGEPKGEFMAVVPVGYPVSETDGPKKRPHQKITKYME